MRSGFGVKAQKEAWLSIFNRRQMGWENKKTGHFRAPFDGSLFPKRELGFFAYFAPTERESWSS